MWTNLDQTLLGLNGSLQEAWGNMRYLTTLKLIGHTLQGPIPALWCTMSGFDMAVSEQKQLDWGPTRVMEQHIQLEGVVTERQQTHWDLAKVAGHTYTAAVPLSLSNNKLNGSLSGSLGKLTKLMYLV